MIKDNSAALTAKVIAGTPFDFYEDSPFNFNDHYKEIDALIPSARFILTTREPQAWCSSFIRWRNFLLKEGHDINTLAFADFVYGRGIEEENREHLVRCYQKRNKEIKAYFAPKPEKLCIIPLEMDSESKWNRLCSFLGVAKVPSVPWPHKNPTPT